MLTAVLLLYVGLASSGVVEHSQRVLSGKPLSDKPHEVDVNDGDYEYDHDAFLGDQAEYFDSLSPEESQRRLGLLCDKIDIDGDGMISQEELRRWIRYVQEKEILEDTEQQWQDKLGEGANKSLISWQEYRQHVFGFIEEDKPETGYNFRPMMERDEKRWSKADGDSDGFLNKMEFQAFLHPEDHPNMVDIVVLETLEDMDRDKDGGINEEEYIADIYKGEAGDSEPDWVAEERKVFTTERDSDGDGFMTFEEIKRWIVPEDFDHADTESKYLVAKVDVSGDGLLSKEEIMEQYDVFVGSSATKYGDILARHDEF